MSAHDEERIQQLLKQALPPIEDDARPQRDLWPAMLRRLDAKPAPLSQSRWIWFDWALVASLAIVAVSFPASVPLLLYYL